MARFISSPDTFFVEEIPAYLPAGDGEHAFLWIEKKGLTTMDAVARVARALGIDPRDVGYAGMKDRNATTRQWLSLLGVDVERARAVAVDGLTVLEASRHRNKLRVGHLDGNRFEVVLDELADGEGGPDGRVATTLRALAVSGVPNRYGHQRFGRKGDNVETGLAILRGTRREPDSRRRKLLLSAVQSAVFNRVLELRERDGGLLRVREGDILEKTASGGQFACTDVATDQARVDAGEVCPTAPLPGNRVKTPVPGSSARALEDQAMAELGIGEAELAQVGRSLPGTRRPVVIKIRLDEPVALVEEGRLRIRFSLPAGAYATVVLEAMGVRLDAGGEQAVPAIAEE
jgi:tRNA pseudouridine13 synthase